MEPSGGGRRRTGMTIKMTRIAGAAAGVLLAISMTACDNNDSVSADDETKKSSASQSESTPADENEDKQSDSESGKEDGMDDSKGVDGKSVTLTGKVEAGVEAGCLVLKHEGETYNLIGGDKKILKAGAEVEVAGTLKENMMTTCMQGKPFQVSKVTAK